MNSIFYAVTMLCTDLVYLCQAKHAQMEVYHVHKGYDTPWIDNIWTKVIEEWPDKPTNGVGMDELNKKFMAKVLNKLGEMLQQLAYDRRLSTAYIRSVKLMHMFGFALASTKCVEGPYYHCEFGYTMHLDIKLVMPCFSFVVGNAYHHKFECEFRIHPYHNSRYNITFNNFLPKPPVCHTNSMSIDGSRPFCGARGGLVTTSTCPMIKIAMTEYELFNPNGSHYSMSEVAIRVLIQINKRNKNVEQLYLARQIVDGPYSHVALSLKRHSNTVGLYSYRTESPTRGCISLFLYCKQYPYMSAFLALNNGAVEFRKNRQTMILKTRVFCFNSGMKVCGVVGDILAHIDVKMQQSNQPLFKVLFNQDKMSCKSNFNVFCSIPDLQVIHYNQRRVNFSLDSTFEGRPAAFYIEKRFLILPDENNRRKYLFLEFWAGTGRYLPVRGCGAGGLYVISDNKDEWSLGPYCGGYATNTLSFLHDKSRVNLGKSVVIIMKGYVRQFAMKINIGIGFSECKGYVNPTVPSSVNVKKFSMIISEEPEQLQQFMSENGKDMKPVIFADFRECPRITIMESDDHYLPSSLIPIIPVRKNEIIIYTAFLVGHTHIKNNSLPAYVVPPKELHHHLVNPKARFTLERGKVTQFQSDQKIVLLYNNEFFVTQFGEVLIFTGNIPPKRKMCELLRPYKDYSGMVKHKVWYPLINPCGIFTNDQVETNFTFLSGTHIEYNKLQGCCQLHIYVNQSSGCSGQTVITSNRFYLIAKPLGQRKTHYSRSMLKADYAIQGTGPIVLPDYQNTTIILPNQYIHNCSVSVSFLYKSYSFKVLTPSYAVEYDKARLCIKQVCYDLSIVKDMTWTQASGVCQSTEGHLPSFKDIRDISLLIYSGLSSVIMHPKVNYPLKDQWNIRFHEIHGFPEKSYRILHSAAALLGAEFIYTSLSRKTTVGTISHPFS